METILSKLSKIWQWCIVPKCIACGKIIEPDLFMCDECAGKWIQEKSQICPECSGTPDICKCVPEALRSLQNKNIRDPIWIGFYDSSHENGNTFNETIIYKFKRQYSKRTIRFFALEMSAKILTVIRESAADQQISDFIITYVPRSKDSIREYGFDHSKKLSEEISKITGISHAALIMRKAGTVQKNLNYAGRIKNAAISYDISKTGAQKAAGRHIILIDDIITTGATIAACAKILSNTNIPARSIIPAAVMRTI